MDGRSKYYRQIALIVVLLLVRLSCLWADGQTSTETYSEPINFKVNWSVTNEEQSSWFFSEYNDTPRIVNNTVTLDSADTENFQPVCKLTYTTNKIGVHEFYCKASPFIVEIDGQSYTSGGYTLMFSYTNPSEDSDYVFNISPTASAGNPVFFYLPITIMFDQLVDGTASQVIYIGAILSDMDSMLPGTNTAQITFVKVVQ